MVRVRSTGWMFAVLCVYAVVLLGGCGGGVEPGNYSATPPGAGPPAPPLDGEPGAPAPPPLIPPPESWDRTWVFITIYISAYPNGDMDQPEEPFCIEHVSVETWNRGDQFDVSAAHAEVHRADGAVQPLTMEAAPEGNRVVLRRILLTPSTDRLNTVVIDGPVRVRAEYGGGECVVGRLEFGAECLADGTVVVPDLIETGVPVTEDASLDYLWVDGLSREPRDWLKVIVVDNYGGRSESPPRKATGWWGWVNMVGDGWGGSYKAISGPDSVLSLLFARTDGDGDGIPDLLQ